MQFSSFCPQKTATPYLYIGLDIYATMPLEHPEPLIRKAGRADYAY